MTPKVSRGGSHKALGGYLSGGGGAAAVVEIANDNAPVPQPQQREGFTKLYNFAPGEAKDISQAVKVMALTVRDADLIKKEAGIKPGGAKAKGGSAYHLMLSWHPSENPTEAEMVQAAEGCLAAIGLGVEKGYQTYIKAHKDTPHPHVHVHVNLVHPETGLQANPHRDQKRAQAWAHAYDKARGNDFCPERTKKHEDREKWIDLGRPRRPTRDFDRAARGAAVKPAVALLKADTAKRYDDLKATEKAERDVRRAESRQLVKERRAGREAIYGQYAPRLNAVWNAKSQQGPRPSPDRGALPEAVIRHNERRDDFRQNELSMLGRLRNASSLAGPKAGLFSKLRLALDADRRQDLFETQERAKLQAVMPPKSAPATPQPATPVPKTLQAARLKDERKAALSAYDAQTHKLADAMLQRHAAARQAADSRRVAVGKEVAAAWQQLRTNYRLTAQPQKEFTRAAAPKIQVTGHFQQGWDTPYKIVQATQPQPKAPPPPAQTQAAQVAKPAVSQAAETKAAPAVTPARREGPDFKQVFKPAATTSPAQPFARAAAPEQATTRLGYSAQFNKPPPPLPPSNPPSAAPELEKTAAARPSAPGPGPAPERPAAITTPATPAKSEPTPAAPEIEPPERKADQFGRSRDRAPRAPRDPARREQQRVAREAARAGKSAQDAARMPEGQDIPAATPPPAHEQPPARAADSPSGNFTERATPTTETPRISFKQGRGFSRSIANDSGSATPSQSPGTGRPGRR